MSTELPTDLPKTYDPAAIEAATYKTWLDEKCFHAEPTDAGEPYSIVIPPPNVTGALHLGHAINNTLQDILIRKARMEGKNALWIPGLDHAGIATQAVVEKTIKEKEGKDRYSLAETPEKSREELVRRIWKWKQQYGDRIIGQLQRLGCSCDWDRQRFTLDEQCAKAVRETFFKLFKDGLVFRGKRLVNWDTHLQTSISNDEIYHEKIKTNLWHIRYEIVDSEIRGTGGSPVSAGKDHGRAARATEIPNPSDSLRPTHMTVATTRPETLLGDTAVAVHSQDPRWNWAIGKSVRLPLIGRLIPIIADDTLVDPTFGSGVVKVTPAHDPNDYAVWERHRNLPDAIEIINLLNPNGTLNENAGPYAGLYRNKSREKVVADLEAAGLLAKVEPYETEVGHSDRSKTPVEPYLSDQWFVKMAPLAEPALEVVRDGTIKFFPERHAQQYLSWLGEKRDWPISRQLWWGHRIPVWKKHFDSKREFWGTPGSYQDEVNDWLSLLGNEGIIAVGYVHDADASKGLQRIYPDKGGFTAYVCPPSDIVPTLTDTQVELVALIEGEGFTQDPDVLDTWFSSALWPFSTLGWPESTPALAKWYPTSVLLTGRDIITLWVARMVMMGMYNLGNAEGRMQNAELKTPSSGSSANPQSAIRNPQSSGIPFAHVAINPTILDGKGERMSKSKGNGVDPVDIIDTHGADALRFTLATMATETQDVRMPVKKDSQGRNTSDKFDLGRNFCNKLWNASRFLFSNWPAGAALPAYPEKEAMSLADRWIVTRFARTLADANAAIASYRFDLYAKACYDFFWGDFCDWYLEIIKPTLKTPAGLTSLVVAVDVLDGVLRLLHPVTPFITEAIWGKLNELDPARLTCKRVSKRLCKSDWARTPPIDEESEHVFPRLQAIIGAIRNVRNDHKADPRKVLAVAIAAPGEAATRVAEANRGLIEGLATCTLRTLAPGAAPPAESVRVTVNDDCDIYIEGLIDPEAEKLRAVKLREEKTKLIAALKGRLANEGYVAKAPPKLIQETRDQLAAAEAELAKLG